MNRKDGRREGVERPSRRPSAHANGSPRDPADEQHSDEQKEPVQQTRPGYPPPNSFSASG